MHIERYLCWIREAALGVKEGSSSIHKRTRSMSSLQLNSSSAWLRFCREELIDYITISLDLIRKQIK